MKAMAYGGTVVLAMSAVSAERLFVALESCASEHAGPYRDTRELMQHTADTLEEAVLQTEWARHR